MTFWEKAFSSRTKVYYPQAIVQFVPERARMNGGTYTRALVDSDPIKVAHGQPRRCR